MRPAKKRNGGRSQTSRDAMRLKPHAEMTLVLLSISEQPSSLPGILALRIPVSAFWFQELMNPDNGNAMALWSC